MAEKQKNNNQYNSSHSPFFGCKDLCSRSSFPIFIKGDYPCFYYTKKQAFVNRIYGY